MGFWRRALGWIRDDYVFPGGGGIGEGGGVGCRQAGLAFSRLDEPSFYLREKA